jgi:hypothetical protein
MEQTQTQCVWAFWDFWAQKNALDVVLSKERQWSIDVPGERKKFNPAACRIEFPL